jgi:BirA family biotin operon repressor/biotin-[acetyl-CoA-carboxylase] ligase
MKLDIRGVKEHMNNDLITGFKYFDSVTSTNELALNLKENEAAEGLVIIGGEQTKGRGRLQRNWHSPKGLGLWFSIILKPQKDFDRIPLLTLIGALSVQKAAENIGINTDLKWPNDILFNNKKVCGILSQFRSSGNEIERVVVGIGINVNQQEFPEDLKDTSTSLRIINGSKINRENLLTDILDHFAYYYKIYKSGNYNQIIDIWKTKMSMLNQNITLQTSTGQKIKGKVVDISNKGQLILELPDNTRRKFIAGDVSIDKNSITF